jgi:hypothetical protein
VLSSLPPREIVIEAGPIGGTYDEHARAYAVILEEHGFRTTVRNNPDSGTIIDHANDPATGVDVGFAAQPVDPAITPRVRVMATVELQPLFLFYSTALGELVSPVNLLDRSIVLPAPASATAIAAMDLLALYGVTPETARFVHMDITEAAQRLGEGEFDAGFFMLASEHALIRALSADAELAAFNYGDVRSIAINLDYLSTAVLPAGGFDLALSLPPDLLELVGAEVQVVTHEDLHPAAAYALLDALVQRHAAATAVSDIGQYPSFVGTRLPLLDEARDYQQSGRPWTYRIFGTYWGSLVDEFAFLIFALFLITQGYRTIKYLLEALTLSGVWAASGLIASQIRRKDASGHSPGHMGRIALALGERLIDRATVHERARERLAQWRKIRDPAKDGGRDGAAPM